MGESTPEAGQCWQGDSAMSVSRQLYEDMILDHNRAPRNFMRIPQGPLCNAHGFNPICGDDFNIYLQVENNIIKDASFNGAGFNRFSVIDDRSSQRNVGCRCP
jgi:hypothetical protein